LPIDSRAVRKLSELAPHHGLKESGDGGGARAADPYAAAGVGPDLTQAQELAINGACRPAGASIVQRAIRTYIDPMTFGTSLATLALNRASSKGRACGYQPNEMMARSGSRPLENVTARQKNGWADIEVDARGRSSGRSTAGARARDSVYLSSMRPCSEQPRNRSRLGSSVIARPRGFVVVDPRTGEVLALVSLLDTTQPLHHTASAGRVQKAADDPNRPLSNRAISGQYAPGSTSRWSPPPPAAGRQDHADTLLGLPQLPERQRLDYHNWASYNLGQMNVAKGARSFLRHVLYSGRRWSATVTLARYARAFGSAQSKDSRCPVCAGLVPDRIWSSCSAAVPDLNSDACRWSTGRHDHLWPGSRTCSPPRSTRLSTSPRWPNGGRVMKPTLVHDCARLRQDTPSRH